MFLLGAGASAEAGVPTSFDMTKAIVDRLNAGHKWGKHPRC
jgi:NAD-dependent SIR2 family protein deacetylase